MAEDMPVKNYHITPEKLLYFSTGVILFLVVSSGILYYCWKINLIDSLPGFSICLFHKITGKPCPGCGMSRAFLLLGQFRIKDALEANLFSGPLLLLMLSYFVFGRVPLWLENKYVVCLFLFAVLLFWMIRLLNI
jgi:hypothetical protein